MGTFFNKAFRSGTIDARTAEITKTYTWRGQQAPEQIIAEICDDLSLASERKFVSFSYYIVDRHPTMVAIGYGKKMGTAFTMVVGAEATTGGHQGTVELVQYLTQDAMPIHIDKVKALRERILERARSAGCVIEQSA